MSKRILILVGIPAFNYDNQMSAVASFLKTIKTAFEEEGHLVEFGNDNSDAKHSTASIDSKKGLKATLKGMLKKWPWLYHSLAYRGYFKQQDNLFSELSQRKAYDLIIEFHTAGSTLGKQLAAHWNCSFSVVFDSPVEEQFYEMHQTKTAHWSRIVQSEKNTLEAANQVMVYSPACETHIRSKYKVTAQVKVLPCVINKESIKNSPVDGVFNITFIGSFLSWHKVPLLVQAFQAFHKKHANAKLQLVGFGVEWAKVNELVQREGMNDHVEMPGFVSEEELLAYKKACTVAIMPGSNWYGSPLKLFEYAQSEIPFIAPSTKTVTAIFKAEEHCLFIDPTDELNSLIKNLTFLHENPLKRGEMAKRANQYVTRHFSEEIYADNLVEVLAIIE